MHPVRARRHRRFINMLFLFIFELISRQVATRHKSSRASRPAAPATGRIIWRQAWPQHNGRAQCLGASCRLPAAYYPLFMPPTLDWPGEWPRGAFLARSRPFAFGATLTGGAVAQPLEMDARARLLARFRRARRPETPVEARGLRACPTRRQLLSAAAGVGDDLGEGALIMAANRTQTVGARFRPAARAPALGG